MNKEYLTIEEQIDHLSNDKGIDKNTMCKDFFREISYLDLVNPYSDLISLGRDAVNKNHIYNTNENFDKFIECNQLDDSISSFLRHALGTFEKSFKSFLMNTYCKKMHSSGDLQVKDYSWIGEYKKGNQVFDLLSLNEDIYRGNKIVLADDDYKVKNRIKVLDEILEASQNQNPSNLMAKHYLRNYSYIPMFVVIHTLSLGQLITLFEMLNSNDKTVFFRYYLNNENKRIDGIHLNKYINDFKTLNIIRNITNHYEPIFPFLLNYYNNKIKELLDVFINLKNHYIRCATKSNIFFNNLKELSFSSNSYSKQNIERIHKIIAILK